MTHSLKGRKQKPEHVAERMAAVRLAMQRPEVKAKMSKGSRWGIGKKQLGVLDLS